jgi:peptide/nickel transport system substrate-binding protein
LAEGYWNRYWQTRRSRRHFLGGATALGAGAAGLALVGCGDDDNGGKNNLSSLATPTVAANASAQASPTPADPFASAKRGGTLKLDQTNDVPSLDPYGATSFLTKAFAAFPYSRLFKLNAGPGIKPEDVVPTPDLAAKFEASPDALTWTVTLRDDVKFHNIAPLNGRALSTDDIKYSWGRATDPKNTNATQLGFVDTVTYPDAKTVVFKLKSPNAAFLEVFADANLFWVIPKEADTGGGFDITKGAIGTGPWIFNGYQQSVAIHWKKNPDWFGKTSANLPLVDAIDYAIIPEYANRRAQLLAGNTDASGVDDPNDLVPTKQQIPNIKLYGVLPPLTSILYFDNDPASPWNKDQRVRQAISESIDRNAITEAIGNISKLKAAGIDVSTGWNNIIPAGLTKYWLDPQGPDIGEGGKYFKYNISDAKALLSAAGFGDGFDATFQYPATVYGQLFETTAQATIGYLNALGIKTNVDVQNYTAKYIPQTFAGNFKGIAFGYETPFPEAGSYVQRYFLPNPNNHGHINDPDLAALAQAQQKELDPAKRKQDFYDIQKQNAVKMYYIPNQAGAVTGWTAYQPYLQNAFEIHTRTSTYAIGTESLIYWWLNK